MIFEDLVGNHILSGVDYGSKIVSRYGDEDDSEYVTFILDNVAYTAIEDPEDGYRSCCDDLIVNPCGTIHNAFDPVEVVCKMRENDDYEVNDVLEVYDVKTEKLILAIGTMNTDDYYPWFEFEYNPENMILNQNMEENN